MIFNLREFLTRGRHSDIFLEKQKPLNLKGFKGFK